MSEIVFIVGSPRSGTSLLGRILDHHPQVALWYEPYFLIGQYLRGTTDARLTSAHASVEMTRFLQKEYSDYRKARGARCVIDKSPSHSLRIPFWQAIFPEVKFIHIVRDGRDATLSIAQRWQEREVTMQKKRALRKILAMKNNTRKQHLWRHKWRALAFETGGIVNFLRGKSQLYHLQQWDGYLGWGPRFPGWRELYEDTSRLQFSAYQWRRCVEYVLSDQYDLKKKQFLEIRYEQLLRYPEETIGYVCKFLGMYPLRSKEAFSGIHRNNYEKWRSALSSSEKEEVGPILQPLLYQLGYAGNASWYEDGM